MSGNFVNITQETADFFESEAIRFEELNERLNDPDISLEEQREIIKQLAPEIGFRIIRERFEQIRDIDNAQIFYDTGYRRAFGKTNSNDDLKYALAAMLLCVFMISPLIAGDNKYRMCYVISSTSSGWNSYIRRNILTAGVYGLISSLLWIIPYAAVICRYYGHSGLSASVRSIAELVDFPVNITVFQYIVLLSFLRTAGIIIASAVMLWISSKYRNTTSAILINFAVFALPVIIFLLGNV